MKLHTLCALLALLGTSAHADDLFTKIDADPKSELWIDSGFATYHFDRDKNLNGGNRGLGFEYRFSGTMAAAGGNSRQR